MGNKNRTLIFEQSSTSGKLLARYYDTGCLVGFNSDNLKPTRNGEGGVFRVVGLQSLDLVSKASRPTIHKLIEKLDALAPFEYIFDIDISSLEKVSVLHDYLNHKENNQEERLLAFAAFLSNLINAHDLSFAMSLELVSRNRENLLIAHETNSLQFMTSRYLNLTNVLREKSHGRLDLEEINQIWAQESDFPQDRILRNFVSDFENRVPLVGLERRKRKRYDDQGRVLHLALPEIFPQEGFSELHAKLLENNMVDARLGSDLSLLTYHALKVGGSSRASEFVRFACLGIKALREERLYKGVYPWTPCGLEELLELFSPEATVENVIDAIEEDGIPFDIAALLI